MIQIRSTSSSVPLSEKHSLAKMEWNIPEGEIHQVWPEELPALFLLLSPITFLSSGFIARHLVSHAVSGSSRFT